VSPSRRSSSKKSKKTQANRAASSGPGAAD
jgi:hypothetical protein